MDVVFSISIPCIGWVCGQSILFCQFCCLAQFLLQVMLVMEGEERGSCISSAFCFCRILKCFSLSFFFFFTAVGSRAATPPRTDAFQSLPVLVLLPFRPLPWSGYCELHGFCVVAVVLGVLFLRLLLLVLHVSPPGCATFYGVVSLFSLTFCIHRLAAVLEFGLFFYLQVI